MDNPTLASTQDLVSALTSQRLYWRDLNRRHSNLDELVRTIVSTPMFRHTYSQAVTPMLEAMLFDVRGGTGMLVNNIFTIEESRVFQEMGLTYHLNLGLALTARKLRARLGSIPSDQFVRTARLEAFSTILYVVGDDLARPYPVLQELVERLSIDPQERMALLQSALANLSNTTRPTLQ